MLSAAATAIGSVLPGDANASTGVLPPLAHVSEAADAVALAVARQAVAEHLAEQLDDEQIFKAVDADRWTPEYRPRPDMYARAG
jgi:malate dehydrogenase (oxaloacetate-decarboxylating)